MGRRELASNFLAGVTIAALNITVAISVAAVIFVEVPQDHLAVAVTVLLVGTIVVGLSGTLFSGFHGVICGARVAFAPVIAVMVGSIYDALAAEAPEQVMPTILAAIMATSALTGILLVVLGWLRLGNLVRYIPYPVMGGFFAGIGVILIEGGLTVATGAAPRLDNILEIELLQLGAPALTLAALLYVGMARFDRWYILPLMLAAAVAVFYMVFAASGQSLDDLTRTGWLSPVDSSWSVPFPVLDAGELPNVNWRAIASESGAIVIVALLAAIMLLLDTAGIEIITRKNLSPDDELKTMGGANIVAGLLGGYPGVHVASDTALTHRLGGDTRLMGFVYAGMVLIALLAGMDFVGFIPAFVLGALLIYLGLNFLVEWIWKARKLLPVPDYLTVVAILVAIVTLGILKGVAFGFAVALVLFVVSYSRLSVIRNTVSGREHASNVDRDLDTRQYLNEQGDRILIVMLQGFIFFGTAEKMLSDICERLEEKKESGVEFLVLNFRHVSQLDISAIKVFSKLSQLGDTRGFHILVTEAQPEWIRRLDSIGFLSDSRHWKRLTFDELDDGIAWCELEILRESGLESSSSGTNLTNLLCRILQDNAQCHVLEPYFEKETREEGAVLFKQGDRGNSLYLVGGGSLAIVFQSADREKVLRYIQAGGIIGEMALYTSQPRSARARVEEDAVLYRLDLKRFESLQRTHPEAAGQLHSYIVRLLSERVARLNQELQYL